jgi:predicted ABC-type ATPase
VRLAAIRKEAAEKKAAKEERKKKLKAYVEEKTPEPPVGAPWVGHDDKPDAETKLKYFEVADDPEKSIVRVKDPDRAELHEAIKEHLIGKATPVPDNETPVAVLMMGGSGSGKSTMKDGLGINFSNFVNIDADEIKTKLPEFREQVQMKHRPAAMNVHEESSYVAKQLRNESMDARYNMVVDGTGANEKTYSNLIDSLKARGYHVHLYMAQLPKDLAKERAERRAERTGRHVKTSDFDRIHESVPRNYERLARKADTAALFDTNVPLGTRPIKRWAHDGGVETVFDKDFVETFRQKYGRG